MDSFPRLNKAYRRWLPHPRRTRNRHGGISFSKKCQRIRGTIITSIDVPELRILAATIYFQPVRIGSPTLRTTTGDNRAMLVKERRFVSEPSAQRSQRPNRPFNWEGEVQVPQLAKTQNLGGLPAAASSQSTALRDNASRNHP